MSQNPDHAQVQIPPPLLMLIHLAATLVLDWLLPFPPIMPSLLRWLGVLLVLSGLFLAFMAARQFLQAHTTLDLIVLFQRW